jgi:hypothetical protein
VTETFDRELGRVEARVATLSEEIVGMRKELSDLSRSVEKVTTGHHERLSALEAFRRWSVGVITGMFLSGVAAVFGYLARE